MKQYQDLDALLKAEPKAAAIFDQLPQYAKAQIMARGKHVNALNELEGYIQNVLRGDG